MVASKLPNMAGLKKTLNATKNSISMNRSLNFFLAGILGLSVISCKKDLDTVQSPESEETVVAKTSDESAYIPFEAGGNYEYTDSTAVGANTSSSAYRANGDTTVNGKTFSRTNINNEGAVAYQNTTDGVTTVLSFNGDQPIINTILKANEPVGSTWVDESKDGNITTTYAWRMVAKDHSKTIGGTTYNKVIQVHLDGSLSEAGKGKIVFADADYFYAPNIGLIETISYNTVTGKQEVHRVLQRYGKS